MFTDYHTSKRVWSEETQEIIQKQTFNNKNQREYKLTWSHREPWQGAQGAMAEQGAQGAITEQGVQGAMAEQPPWPWPRPGLYG